MQLSLIAISQRDSETVSFPIFRAIQNQAWNCSRKVSELYTDFYTTQEFTRQFEKLDAVKKTFELKDPEGKVYLDVKMIDLNRHTLALYRRLDDKNKGIVRSL